jgi:asparagine synthase (glutamine-hydrolysing)
VSGLCGICEPGRQMDSRPLEPMLSALAVPGEAGSDTTAGSSVTLGVAQRWESQQVAAIAGVRIAIDADLHNVPELKARLAAQGFDSAQWSLARCLAHLYEICGADFLLHLHGVFSLALWDEKAQRLILAIDRLGAKALYWSREGDRLLLASRLGAIRAARATPLEINPAAISQFLIFSVIPHPITIYRGVEKLAPATCLIYEKGEVRQRRYWNLAYLESDERGVSHWAQQTRDAMRAAVHLHAKDCIPEKTGAFLSGGTDSSSVVAFMNELHSPVNTFSIFFGEAAYSEVIFARTTASHFKTRHYERQLGPRDAFEALPKIAQYYDEPFANSSAFGAYYCAMLAREAGVDMLLAGDGGDELFAGNSRYSEDKRFALYHSLPAWFRSGVLEPATRLLPENGGALSLPRRYVRRARIPNPRRIFSYNLLLSTDPEEVFEPDFLAQTQPETWLGIAESHFHSARASSELNRLLYLDVNITLADNDLRKVLGTAELAGVRVRFPLLDYRLAEFSAQIPAALKLRGFHKRYIFKKAMQQILPPTILYKKKHGFGVPLGHWLIQDRQLNQLTQDLLFDLRTRQRGYFRPAFLERLLRLHRHEHAGFYGEFVWYLLALELWHRQHGDLAPGRHNGN